MATVKVLVLRAPGTNCDMETCHAFERVGASPSRMHVNALLKSNTTLSEYQVLVLPGGFSYGDDVAAGKILANQLQFRLAEAIERFRDAGRLILGICNGFQILIKSGFLPGWDDGGQISPATLTYNVSGRFEDRWVHLVVTSGHCPLLAGITQLELPVAHAEGRFVCPNKAFLGRLVSNGQITLRYSFAGSVTPDSDILPYPANPNGSEANVAGICDATGRILGLMPHPERFIDPIQHPRWTRSPAMEFGTGLQVFRNAVRFFS